MQGSVCGGMNLSNVECCVEVDFHEHVRAVGADEPLRYREVSLKAKLTDFVLQLEISVRGDAVGWRVCGSVNGPKWGVERCYAAVEEILCSFADAGQHLVCRHPGSRGWDFNPGDEGRGYVAPAKDVDGIRECLDPAVTSDGFCLARADSLKGCGIPCLHVVAAGVGTSIEVLHGAIAVYGTGASRDVHRIAYCSARNFDDRTEALDFLLGVQCRAADDVDVAGLPRLCGIRENFAQAVKSAAIGWDDTWKLTKRLSFGVEPAVAAELTAGLGHKVLATGCEIDDQHVAELLNPCLGVGATVTGSEGGPGVLWNEFNVTEGFSVTGEQIAIGAVLDFKFAGIVDAYAGDSVLQLEEIGNRQQLAVSVRS